MQPEILSYLTRPNTIDAADSKLQDAAPARRGQAPGADITTRKQITTTSGQLSLFFKHPKETTPLCRPCDAGSRVSTLTCRRASAATHRSRRKTSSAASPMYLSHKTTQQCLPKKPPSAVDEQSLPFFPPAHRTHLMSEGVSTFRHQRRSHRRVADYDVKHRQTKPELSTTQSATP